MNLVGDAVAALCGQRILVVGDLLLDAYVYGDTARVSREAPVLVVRKQSREFRLGGAANTAANLQALGCKTHMVGVVGDDDDGRRVRKMLASLGADCDGVVSGFDRTAVKTRVLAGAVGTAKQQVLRLDDEPGEPVGSVTTDVMQASIQRLAPDVDAIVFSDYGMGALDERMVGMVDDLRRAGHRVYVDSRYRLSKFGGAWAVKPNIPEAEAFVGFPITTTDDVVRAGKMIRQQLACEAVLLTQGRAGMTLFAGHDSVSHIDIVGEGEVTDVTGAGDTVMATFAAACAAGLGFENGMRLANCAAGIVVSRVGASCITPDELRDVAEGVQLELEPWER